MKRDYPLFLIDRSKHSTYPFDYITCLDRAVGFVCRVVVFFDDKPLEEFITQTSKIDGFEYTSSVSRLKKGGVVFVIEDFLYHFEPTNENKSRIKTLLKKAIKKYLHAEIDRSADGKDTNIENQIKQQELSIEMAKRNYNDLVNRANGDNLLAEYQIKLAEATLDTLKKYRDNLNFFNIGIN